MSSCITLPPLLHLLAQTPPAPVSGFSYALLLSTIAAEATLSALTWAAFNAEARLQKDRDTDVRDAIAGYDSGRVVPALATLIEAVLAVRRPEEPIRDALDRADISGPLDAMKDAAAASRSPREIESRAVRIWNVAGSSCVGVQLSAPILLTNAIAGEDVMSQTVQTIAGIVLSGSTAILVVAMIFVRQLTRALTRAIRDGKDAADAA